jgi:hypothetical protein
MAKILESLSTFPIGYHPNRGGVASGQLPFYLRQRDAALRLCRLGRRCKVRLMTKLLALWSGDLALNEAFWTWTVTVGLLVNIATSILFLVLILQDQLSGAVLVG